jgi:DNA-binding transcriptional regulator YdaS (Cro superfamily)
MSEEAFAALVDGTCTQSLVSKWRRGLVLPSAGRAYDIEHRITRGEVTQRGLALRYKRVKAARKARGEAFRKERGIE